MDTFLGKTADFIIRTFGYDLEHLCVVLPNRRAGLFLKNHLASRIEKPVWVPDILPIEDFMIRLSGLSEIDQPDLTFELFETYLHLFGEHAMDFGDFSHRAPRILADFNDVDRSMANPHELFTNLSEAKAISLWNPDGRPLTDFQQKYLRFFQSLDSYYQTFTTRLLEKKQAYLGLIFRQVAENIESIIDNMTYSHVIFAGFNAITKAEELVIDALRSRGLCTLLWDGDQYYVENKDHEAGSYLRRWISRWPVLEPMWISTGFSEKTARLNIIGVPDAIGQVKYCGNLLKQLAENGMANENTAIVLPDMTLLTPLLNSIPASVGDLNITAGIPLSQTPLNQFLDLIGRMHFRTSGINNQSPGKSQRFHYQDILKVLLNPFVQMVADSSMEDGLKVEAVVNRIRTGDKAYFQASEIITGNGDLFTTGLEFLTPAFATWTTPLDAITSLRQLLVNFYHTLNRRTEIQRRKSAENSDRPSIEMEQIFRFSEIFNRLSTILNRHSAGLNLKDFWDLFKQITSSSSLSLYGEPLKGVQLMGMLETRALDFKNLVILSCNDDILPSGKTEFSFIPYDIRHHFRLPLSNHRETVYAYHFYRLLQRADNIWLVYSTDPGPLGGGEKSRFIRQLIHELPEYNPGIQIEQQILTTPVLKESPGRFLEYPKTGATLDKLMSKSNAGLSASSLNAFRRCPLQFYFSEIAEIKESKELTDEIDAAMLGTAVHKILQDAYKPLTGKNLNVSDFQQALVQAGQLAEQVYDKKLKTGGGLSGKNLLLVNVTRLLADKVIKWDLSEQQKLDRLSINRRILRLEYYLTANFPVTLQENQIQVKLKGVIDRVDLLNGTHRIIDYKTGTVDAKGLSFNEWSDFIDNPQLDIAFQLMFYALLLSYHSEPDFRANLGILSPRAISKGLIEFAIGGDDNQNKSSVVNNLHVNQFKNILQSILAELLDTTKAFSQTNDLARCQRCPYINVCGR